jgi:Polysaccharide deacetylase
MRNIHQDRREFIAKALCVAAGAGLAGLGLPSSAVQAQTAPRPIRRSERYEDSFITERKPFKWPGDNTLAVWFAPNVEVWHFDSAFGVGVSPNPANYLPDVYNYAWREYGMRVGLWRMADVLDQAGVKATVPLNAQVCEVHPKAVEEMKKRGWEFMGHGTTNSTTLAGLPPEQEPRHPQDDRAGERKTPARLARLRTDRDPQHPRHPGRGGRDLLRRLEQRRSALPDEGEVGKDVLDPLLRRDQRHPALHPQRLYRRAISQCPSGEMLNQVNQL